MIGRSWGVGGASIGGKYGGRGSTEGARVYAGSVGVAIDVVKILTISWIACNCFLPRVEGGVSGKGVMRAAVRSRAAAIVWLAEKVCGNGHWWRKNGPSW